MEYRSLTKTVYSNNHTGAFGIPRDFLLEITVHIEHPTRTAENAVLACVYLDSVWNTIKNLQIWKGYQNLKER